MDKEVIVRFWLYSGDSLSWQGRAAREQRGTRTLAAPARPAGHVDDAALRRANPRAFEVARVVLTADPSVED